MRLGSTKPAKQLDGAMAEIIFVEHDGTEHRVSAERGRSVMQVALEEGIPGELVWIAEVESAMDPSARSRSGAVGLFQLMPETARRFGLDPGAEKYDERIHPYKSGAAAARYLRALLGRD